MRKQFFRTPTKKEILGHETVKEAESDLINKILELYTDQAMIIKRQLIPEGYDARKFMKHGPDVKLRRTRSLKQILEEPRRPVDLRNEAMAQVPPRYIAGYTFKPFIGTDKRTRKVHLVECLEGAKLVAYCNSDIAFRPRVQVKPYADARRVERDGAEIHGLVPSRTKGHPNHEVKFSSVPVADNNWKWGLSYSIKTEHNCKSKLFNIRYTYDTDRESSLQLNFCAHDYAMYMGIIDHFWHKDRNIVPLEQCQFAIPTQFTVDFYKKLDNNVLIHDKQGIRKPHRADKEILLWGLVYATGRDHDHRVTEKGFDIGHEKTFYAVQHQGNYDWA